MRSRAALAAFAVVAALLMGAAGAWAQAGTDEDPALRIPMAEFKKLRASGAVAVVDVRSPESYAEGHIPGALSVPLEDLQDHLSRLRALKKPIVTYCA